MFEHLTPTSDSKAKNQLANFRIYFPAFIAAVFVFILALSIGKGPASLAQGEKLADLSATVSVDPSDKKIVLGSQDVSVFDWVLNVGQNESNLSSIRIYIDGLYNPQLLEDLLLYYRGEPLEADKKIDSQGNIYFELEDFDLPTGQHHFSLFLSNTDKLSLGNVFRFVLADAASLSLSYQDHKFVPQGEWPLQGGLVTIVDNGQILAFSRSADKKFLTVSDLPQQVASFVLATDSEMVDVNHLEISLTGADIDSTKFVLISDKKLLAEAQVKDSHLFFDLEKPITLSGKNQPIWELHALSLPMGTYEFSLDKVSGIGFASGKDISLSQAIKLSQTETESFFPEFTSGELHNKLTEGLNELYDLKVRARGREQLKIYKLSWLLEAQNVNINKAEIKVDDETYVADINILDNKIVVKANWARPIIVRNIGTDIKLLLDVDNLKDKASIRTYLLPDQSATVDQAQASILWAAEEKLYNSYRLPFLPLLPNILSN